MKNEEKKNQKNKIVCVSVKVKKIKMRKL